MERVRQRRIPTVLQAWGRGLTGGVGARRWAMVGGFGVRVGEDLGEGGNFRPLPSETDRIGPPG